MSAAGLDQIDAPLAFSGTVYVVHSTAPLVSSADKKPRNCPVESSTAPLAPPISTVLPMTIGEDEPSLPCGSGLVDQSMEPLSASNAATLPELRWRYSLRSA